MHLSTLYMITNGKSNGGLKKLYLYQELILFQSILIKTKLILFM